MTTSHQKPRPEVLPGHTFRMITGCGKLYITVNNYEDAPFELFGRMGKAGGCAAATCEGIGRLVSALCRANIPISVAIKQLTGIHCHSSNEELHSCPSAVGEVLKRIQDEISESEHPGTDGDQRSGSPAGED